jgi:hypothetical protein
VACFVVSGIFCAEAPSGAIMATVAARIHTVKIII